MNFNSCLLDDKHTVFAYFITLFTSPSLRYCTSYRLTQQSNMKCIYRPHTTTVDTIHFFFTCTMVLNGGVAWLWLVQKETQKHLQRLTVNHFLAAFQCRAAVWSVTQIQTISFVCSSMFKLSRRFSVFIHTGLKSQSDECFSLKKLAI